MGTSPKVRLLSAPNFFGFFIRQTFDVSSISDRTKQWRCGANSSYKTTILLDKTQMISYHLLVLNDFFLCDKHSVGDVRDFQIQVEDVF